MTALKKHLTNTLIQLNNIDVTYSDNKGIHAINLSIETGEIIAITGKSGCGKSTLLRLLSGLIQPTSGSMNLATNQIKMVFQHHALLPWLTVSQNIEIGLQYQGLSIKNQQQRISEVLNLIGLPDVAKKRPNQLSGGMCQRIGFARALISEPAILLMDEPFSALDAMTSEELSEAFFSMIRQRQFKTESVVYVTHDIRHALDYADRILILDNKGTLKHDLAIDHARLMGYQKIKTML